MPWRLLHLADTHIGTETYGRIDPATGRHTRLQDFHQCLTHAVDAALEWGVDLALFAGDAYRNCFPTPTQQEIFASAIGRLTAAGVPVVMIPGNHDLPVAFGRATAVDIFSTLAGDRVTVAAKPAVHRVATRQGEVQVACLPWPTPSLLRADDEVRGWSEDQLRAELEQVCAAKIRQLAEECDPAVPSVLLAHVLAADGQVSGSEKSGLSTGDPSLSRSVLADPRFDYVALGHLHRHQQLNPAAQPPVVYCGSIDRLDFGEAAEAKGVALVAIGDGPTPAERVTTYDFRTVPARPFVALEIEVPEGVDPTAWLTGKLAPLELSDAVFRLRYRCSDEQYQQLDLAAVRRAVEPVYLIAGLIREPPASERRPRIEVTEHQGLAEALGRYLDTRPELAPQRETLLVAAADLERRLEAVEAAGSREASE